MGRTWKDDESRQKERFNGKGKDDWKSQRKRAIRQNLKAERRETSGKESDK